MDYVALKQIISDYKSNFSRIREEEDYKWKAVQHFQENWQIDVENFAEMLKISLNKTHNLLAVGSFPRKQEGVYYSSVDKSIAAAKKNFIKFYENL